MERIWNRLKRNRLVSGLRLISVFIFQYFLRKPFSFVLLSLSLVAIVAAVWFSNKLYIAKNPWTTVAIFNSPLTIVNGAESHVVDDIEITKAQIAINYNDDGKQTLTLFLDVRSRNDSLLDEHLTLDISNNLHRSQSEYFNQSVDYLFARPDESITYYYYKFTQPTKTARLIEKFEGNLFGTVKSSINLNLVFTIDHIPTHEIPVEIDVVNLYNLNINYVSPQPIQESIYSVVFSFLHGSNDISDIHLSGTDPAGVSLEQSKIFFIGIGLGVVFSLAITIIYDLIRFIEDKLTRSNQPPVRRRKNLSGSLKFRRRPKPINKVQSKRKNKKPKRSSK